MKLESLVIVNQHVTVNIFGALYTPPVTSGEWDRLEAMYVGFLKKKACLIIAKIITTFNLKGPPSERRTHNRDEVVTR